jgi:hypothetical protein
VEGVEQRVELQKDTTDFGSTLFFFQHPLVDTALAAPTVWL